MQARGIACGGSLNEFRDASVVLAEARRVARDGGRSAFMSLISGDKGPRGLEQVLSESSGIRFYSLAQTRRLFETAGWDVVQQAAWGRVLFSEIRPILNKHYINP